MKSPLGELFKAASNRAPVPVGAYSPLAVNAGSYPNTQTLTALETFNASSTLFTIIDRLATSQASVEWYLKDLDREDTEENRVKVHPALTVFRKPNEFYTESEFIKTSQQHYDLAGEYWWIVGRSTLLGNQGPPIELWPVRPDRMKPIPDPNNFIVGYEYSNGHERIPLELNQVIFTRNPSPISPYRGCSPVYGLLADIEGERAATIYNTLFFRNGAEPGGIIEMAEELDDDQFKKLLRRWRDQHKGVNNAHRVAFLEKSAKWVDRKYTRKDMEFIEGRRFNQEVIRRAYGFPKPLLGDVDDVNRANAEAAAEMFAQWLVIPRADVLKDTLNFRYLPLFGSIGQGYEFDYVDPTPPNRNEDRADEDSKVARAVALIDLGFDPGDVAEKLGLPEMKFVGRRDETGAASSARKPRLKPTTEELQDSIPDYKSIFLNQLVGSRS